MIGENDDALRLRRQRTCSRFDAESVAQTGRCGQAAMTASAGLDAFGQPEKSRWRVRRQPHRAASQWRRASCAASQPVPWPCRHQRDRSDEGRCDSPARSRTTATIARKPAAAFPMGQVGVEEEIGAVGSPTIRAISGTARPTCLRSDLPVDRMNSISRLWSFAAERGDAASARRCWWCARLEADRTRQRRANSSRPVRPVAVLHAAQRPAALAAVEVDPVAGVIALQRDDAGALLARRIALDVGEPPFVADPPAVREQPWHPAVGGVAQPRDDRIEVERLAGQCWLGRR